jgi:molecular chaperone DnaJ
MKDYYQTLGISRTASADEIKKAYRQMAVKFHPDKNQGTQEAEAKFKEIKEAYDFLSDPLKKANYDNPRSGDPFSDFFKNRSPFQDVNLDQFFGRNQRREAQIRKGRNLSAYVSLTLEEMMAGVVKKVNLKRNIPCQPCSGTGAENSEIVKCTNCGGSGKINKTVQHAFGTIVTEEDCQLCKGFGSWPKTSCSICNGQGTVRSEEQIDVSIPKGSISGVSYLVVGKGDWLKQPCNPGDLTVNIDEYVHPFYTRDGVNLFHDKYLTFKEACLGTEIELPNLKGSSFKIQIPAGTSPGKILRLQGKGLPEFNGFGFGDILIKTHLKVPNPLNEEQLEALKYFD